MTTYPDAINEIYGLFKTTLETVAPAIVGSVPQVRYLGRDLSVIPEVSKFWVEVSQITATDRQTGFGVSSRDYTTTGTLYLKIHAPSVLPNSFDKARKLADALKRGYRPRQTAGAVWYRNARVQELPPEKAAYRFNVVVDYTYTERQ